MIALLLCFLWGVCFAAATNLYGADADQGILEVRLKDHREAIGDFSRLTLQIGKIAISPKPGLAFWKTGWREMSPAVRTVDLTNYTGKNSAAVFTGAISAGGFDAIQLKLDAIEGTLKKDRRRVQIKNVLTPIKLSFSIEPKGKTVLILDLVVLDMSDHPPAGYELGIRGYDLYINGKLVDKVPPG